MDVASFLQQCGIGITSGGFLGLIAVGYTLVYGTVGLIHFAHGDVVMLGGCLSLAILSFLVPVPVDPLTGCLVVVLAAACSGLFCGCLNICIDQFVYRPLRNAPPLSPLVSTIGVSFVLMNVGLIWIGPTDRAFPEIFLETTRSVGGFSIAMADLLVLVIVVPAVLCLYVLLRQTRFGRSLRSIAAITRVTARSGEAGKLVIATFFLSGFLGGVASVAAGVHATTINYQMGHQMGLYALTAAVLGGIGSVPGAIVGGLIVGLIRAISVAFLGPRWAIASVFLVLIIFLAHPYHAGLDAKKRHKTQEAFAKETLDVVVATVAFGMGIDRSNVRLVLHTGLPKSLEAYQQETGRAGRDGLAAECVLLYSPADVFSWEALIRRGAESSELTEDESQKLIDSQILHLQRMRQYAQAARCRHAFLSEHFGQSYKLSNCKNCDICLGETTNLADSTTVAQKIISCVARIEERFGVRHLCEVLRGAQTEAVQRNGHHHLSTYGLLKSFDQRMCENLVHQLLDQEYLSRSKGDRPVVMLNQKSWEILRSQRTVTLLEPRLKKAVRSRKESDDWNGVDRQLFDHLRQWRRKIADGRGKPAWTILDDRTLRSIAREKPDTLATLLQCKGIGEKRLADHGTAILKLVKQCDYESA